MLPFEERERGGWQTNPEKEKEKEKIIVRIMNTSFIEIIDTLFVLFWRGKSW